MCTKSPLVLAAEYGVMAAAPGPRSRAVIAHRVGQILAMAAPAMRRLRMSWLG